MLFFYSELKARKENFNRIMPDLEIDMNSNPFGDQNDPDKNFDQISVRISRSQDSFVCFYQLIFQLQSEDQIQLTSQNVEFLEKRDLEIREVLRSIEDVNEIFRDIAALISNQVNSIGIYAFSPHRSIIFRAQYSIKLNIMLKIRRCRSNKEINT